MKAFFVGLVLLLGFIYAVSPRPEKDAPMAKCKDGTVSYSKHRSGTCSRHGGVSEWVKK